MGVNILIIGDLHFRPKDYDLNLLLVNEVVGIIDRLKPDAVVVLGDTLDTHDVYKGIAHTLSVKFFHQIRQITKLIVLIGNHDVKNNQVNLSEGEADHPYIALKYWENTILVDKVTSFNVGQYQFCAVPYLPNGCYLKAIEHLDVQQYKAFFSHQLFDFPGNYEANAEVWPDHYPDNFNGHLHEYLVVKHNLTLVGTPTTTDFGASPDKALMLVTFDDVNVIERIKLTTVPLRITYRIEGNVQNIKKVISEIDPKNIYKVTIYGKPSLLANLRKNQYYRDLKSMVNKVTEESIGTDLVVCKGITDEIIMNGDYDQILFELLSECPKELEMYQRLFKKIK